MTARGRMHTYNRQGWRENREGFLQQPTVELNDRDLHQNVMIKRDKKETVDSHYMQILCMQIYSLKFICNLKNQYLLHFRGHQQTCAEWRNI